MVTSKRTRGIEGNNWKERKQREDRVIIGEKLW
jgi:hypothetical protein